MDIAPSPREAWQDSFAWIGSVSGSPLIDICGLVLIVLGIAVGLRYAVRCIRRAPRARAAVLVIAAIFVGLVAGEIAAAAIEGPSADRRTAQDCRRHHDYYFDDKIDVDVRLRVMHEVCQASAEREVAYARYITSHSLITVIAARIWETLGDPLTLAAVIAFSAGAWFGLRWLFPARKAVAAAD
jgi:hypothetical protein